ncbi:THO complex subunit 6-like isoform X4 [Primulina tabacum]|uniref:THO complex subunit 6-like isoform X4 n=1 Tax=Primulina tabacum TaxID=48773 RepID=UPI003F5A863A
MGMDCRNWDEDAYRESVLGERETLTRTIFRVTFAPNANPNPNSDHFASASSSGSIASCSIDSCLEHGCGTARGEKGSIYAAAGDSHAYCWDVIITGSEDGVAQIWGTKFTVRPGHN